MIVPTSWDYYEDYICVCVCVCITFVMVEVFMVLAILLNKKVQNYESRIISALPKVLNILS